MGKRRTFSSELKFEAVLDMVRGEKTVAQICRERDITESLLYTWRDAFFERAPSLFADPAESWQRQQPADRTDRRIGAHGWQADNGN